MDITTLPMAEGGEGVFGHNADFRNDRMGTLRRLACATDPILRLKLPVPGVHAIVVIEPEPIQEMLVEKGRHFDKSDMLRFSLFPLAGEGLFTSNGELWRKQRKVMAPLFTPKALERYADDMIACAERTVDRWSDGQTFRLLDETTRLTMSIAGKTLFDADTFSEADELGHALTVALSWAGWVMGRPFAIAHMLMRRYLEDASGRAPAMLQPSMDRAIARLRGPLVLFGRRGNELASAIRTLDDRVQRMIDARRSEDSSADDLLSRLLAARDEDGDAMSDRQVRDEVLTLFVAGHETTATGLAWSIYALCKHPLIYREVEREVDALGGPPTVADLPRLSLCLRVFKEALRLYPPVFLFGRDSVGEVSLAGVDLPPRTNVLVCPWALHRLPHVWPNPEAFDPDRFLPEAEERRHRYAYLPFSAGPRVCIGMPFAYMEAQLALASLLRRHRFELLQDDEPEPEATLRPKHGIRVRVTRR